MAENLKLDINDLEREDPLQDIYCGNLKSPDRSKSWKGSRLRRSKTYSGSPSNKIGCENTQINANNPEKPIPLSPVRTKKWGKTNMKRRSSNARLSKSYSERHSSTICGPESCLSLSTIKVEVRTPKDISKNAVMHRYSCPCKQYLDEKSCIIYKLQNYQSECDSNLIEETVEKIKFTDENDLNIPVNLLSSSIIEEDAHQIHTSTPKLKMETVQTIAENTKAEIIASNEEIEFNFDFQTLDDTILDLKIKQDELKDTFDNEQHWSDSYFRQCCNQKTINKQKIATSILESMMKNNEDKSVYILLSIFSYLDVASIYEAGKVCQTWHCASQHPAVWRNVSIFNKTLTAQALHSLSITCVSTQQLSISNCILDTTPGAEDELTNWFTIMGVTLKSLQLINNTDNHMILDNALIQCSGITQLDIQDAIQDDHINQIASYHNKNLTCLKLGGNNRTLSITQFYDIESVQCLTLNATSLRSDHIQNIVSWFPYLRNVHIHSGHSLHSADIKSLFPTDTTWNITFTDVYITPRALLVILFTCRELKSLKVYFSHTFIGQTEFEGPYRNSIRGITDNVLFRDILTVSFEGPAKPQRHNIYPDVGASV